MGPEVFDSGVYNHVGLVWGQKYLTPGCTIM